jgi:hypothetical protein
MYRSGGSGNGRRFINAYDTRSETWTRFLDTPMFEGQGERNAYPRGPIQGPDGLFHVVWVWRDTPDCATNHHLSYARSRDFKHWENAAGQTVPLPFLLNQSQVWVDPIPSGGGIINGCERLAFDHQNRPTIAYHKRDASGNMQIYVARFRKQRWQCIPITAWDKPIPFGGGGAMPFIGIKISKLVPLGDDLFYLGYRHRDYGSGRIILDQDSLQPVERQVSIPSEFPSQLCKTSIDFDGIRVKFAVDIHHNPDAETTYLLRWETLGANHDRPRQPPLPPASALQLVKLQRISE